MAETLEKELGITPDLKKGGGGEFIVTANGTQVFSKKEVGRFPEHEEVLEALKALQ